MGKIIDCRVSEVVHQISNKMTSQETPHRMASPELNLVISRVVIKKNSQKIKME